MKTLRDHLIEQHGEALVDYVAPSKMKRRGVLVVSFELLRDMLRLNDEHEIHAVETSTQDFMQGVCRVYISGPTCPDIPEGGTIPRVVLNHSGGVE